MKKLGLIIGVVLLLCVFNGCITISQHDLDVAQDSASGISSVNGQTIVFCASGYSSYSSSNQNLDFHKQEALITTKKQMTKVIKNVFDTAAKKFSDNYPDKKISGSAIASLGKSTVENIISRAKIISYTNAGKAVGYAAISKIDVNDLGLPSEMVGIFISSANAMIKPDGLAVKMLAAYQEKGFITSPLNADNYSGETLPGANQSIASNSDSNANESGMPGTSGDEEPFWATELDNKGGNGIGGVVSVRNNKIIIYSVAIGISLPSLIPRGGKEKSTETAMKKTGEYIDSIIDETINEYLKSNPSAQPACDTVKTVSKDISSDAAQNSRVISKWIKQVQILFKTTKHYYVLATYEFDIDLLKMPVEMKDIFISIAQGMLSPYAKDYLAIITGVNTAESSEQAQTQSSGSEGSSSSLYQKKIKIILNNKKIVNGILVGQNDSQLFIQLQDDKAQIVKKSDIKAAFDPDTGKEIDFSSNSQNSLGNINNK